MMLNTLVLAILAVNAPHAAEPTTPHAIVQALYAPAKPGDSESSVDAIGRYASKSLKRLIDADNACEKRYQAICNIDSDFLIAGQDGEASHLAIADGPVTAQGQVIDARFDNDGPVDVRFVFVRQGGAWKIDDVEDLRPKDADAFARDVGLKKQLRRKT